MELREFCCMVGNEISVQNYYVSSELVSYFRPDGVLSDTHGTSDGEDAASDSLHENPLTSCNFCNKDQIKNGHTIETLLSL